MINKSGLKIPNLICSKKARKLIKHIVLTALLQYSKFFGVSHSTVIMQPTQSKPLDSDKILEKTAA